MTIREFIRQNREEIDHYIKSCRLNDDERWMWIANDEGLYNMLG